MITISSGLLEEIANCQDNELLMARRDLIGVCAGRWESEEHDPRGSSQ
ncbi:hypothetical protein A2U01_0075338, partial [Trifolium medium]|nr:hypothetical protein [Trifolium medium]